VALRASSWSVRQVNDDLNHLADAFGAFDQRLDILARGLSVAAAFLAMPAELSAFWAISAMETVISSTALAMVLTVALSSSVEEAMPSMLP
jgi:hypothetical protein